MIPKTTQQALVVNYFLANNNKGTAKKVAFSTGLPVKNVHDVFADIKKRGELEHIDIIRTPKSRQWEKLWQYNPLDIVVKTDYCFNELDKHWKPRELFR